MFGMRWMLTVFAINNPQGCRTIVEKWMICRAFLRFQMMLFFYEANGDLIHNNVTNTAIRIVTFFAELFANHGYTLWTGNIRYQSSNYWLLLTDLLDRLWIYSPLKSTKNVYIHNHIIHYITFNPPNASWILGIVSNQGVAKMHVIYVCIFVTNGLLLILTCSWEIMAFLIS